jgi:hypothetical protein
VAIQKIAQKLLGDSNRWQLIFEANRALMKGNPNLILPGWKLTIPPSALGYCGGAATLGMQARLAHLENTTRNTAVVLQDATNIMMKEASFKLWLTDIALAHSKAWKQHTEFFTGSR